MSSHVSGLVKAIGVGVFFMGMLSALFGLDPVASLVLLAVGLTVIVVAKEDDE